MPADDNVIQFPGPRAAADPLAPLLGALGFDPFALRQPALLDRRTERARFTVRIDLDGVRTPVWRRLQLAGDLHLDQLHDILQIAMGWTDSHLHHFVMGPGPLDRSVAPFLTPFDVEEGEQGMADADVRLDEVLANPGDRLYYEYDFGDGWDHLIRLESIKPWTAGAPLATCLDGRRACPPEDVGGVPGYEEMLDMLAGHTADLDPGWVEQVLTWLPEGYDPDAFSVEEVNEQLELPELPPLQNWHPGVGELLRRMRGPGVADLTRLVARAAQGPQPTDADAESLAHRYQSLLRAVGAGLDLTAAGYLPPAIVQALYRDVDPEDRWYGKGNREDLTAPVHNLRTSATALGLLHKSRGRLMPTTVGLKVADDPRALLRHVASRMPLGKPHEKDAGLIALLIMAAGDNPYQERELGGRIVYGLGWRVQGDEYGLAASQWSHPSVDVVRSLGGWHDGEAHRLAARALLMRR